MGEFHIGDKVKAKNPDYWGGRIVTVERLGTDFEGRTVVFVKESATYTSLNLVELVEKAMDLTKIEKPFGLLDKDTQEALRAHGGPYELYTVNGWRFYHTHVNTLFAFCNTYRVRPQPQKTKVELELTPEEVETLKKVLGRVNL